MKSLIKASKRYITLDDNIMYTVKLKKKILERLESINEAHLLEKILGLLDSESKVGVVKIPEIFKEKLEKSIAQKESGNIIPNNEVEESIEKWLYK